jgi:hypothetical protein
MDGWINSMDILVLSTLEENKPISIIRITEIS